MDSETTAHLSVHERARAEALIIAREVLAARGFASISAVELAERECRTAEEDLTVARRSAQVQIDELNDELGSN